MQSKSLNWTKCTVLWQAVTMATSTTNPFLTPKACFHDNQYLCYCVTMATSLLTPSGAYYSGTWSANQKHGRGTLVLQNGSKLHCLFHHDVLVSSSQRPEGVAADHKVLPLRTKTPLTTLIGKWQLIVFIDLYCTCAVIIGLSAV